MVSHGSQVKLFAGNSNPELAASIASALGLELGKCTIRTFSDGEVAVSIDESVRGCDVFVIQSTCAPVNNHLMELLIMADALRRASANRITAVIPYFGYGRQDRKTKAREPITAKLVSNLIETAGYDRVLTMDLHASQIQGFFDIPVDNLMGTSVLLPYFEKMVGVGNPDYAVISPDFGSVTRTRKFAERLDLPLAIIEKRRQKANVSEVMNIIGAESIVGKKVILVDDMVDTAGTLCHGAEALMAKGAKEVIACASHGVLSGPAIERLNNSCISKLLLLDTIPLGEEKKCDKIELVPVGAMFAEAIKRITVDDSVSELSL